MPAASFGLPGTTYEYRSSAGVMTGIKVAIPPEDLAVEFEHVIRDFRSMLTMLTQTNAQLRAIRDALLPRLLGDSAGKAVWLAGEIEETGHDSQGIA
jgi:hypothetical protein